MTKRLLCLFLLCLAVPLAAACADAPELQYINHSDGVNLVDLLPREDGGLLLCGYTYTKNAFQEGVVFADGYRSIRTDAYAVALDANGQEEWHLRIGDPEAFNCFSAIAPIGEGDYLLTYQAAMGTWGTQHYIIGPDGSVKGMLASGQPHGNGPLETLRPAASGFLAGGYETPDGIGHEPMLAAPYLTSLDRNMGEEWRLEDESLYGCLFEATSAGEDGFALAGTHYAVSNSGYAVEGSTLLRLDSKGEILWHKKLQAPEQVQITNVLMLPDGGLLACGMGDPGDTDAMLPGGTLSGFDREGNRTWTKGYHAAYGLYTLTEIAPLGEGFAITDGAAGSGVFHVDANGEVLGRYRPPVVDNALITIYPAQDGGLYLLGSITTPTDEIDDITPVNRAFYVKLTEEDFLPVER